MELVLTAGFRPGTGEPSDSGVLRMRAADEEIRRGRIDAAMIIGGNRVNGPTEAESHRKYAEEHLPALAGKIVLVDAQGMYSVEDIRLAAPKLDDYLEELGETRQTTELAVPTYWNHFRRTQPTIKRLGFAPARWINSGETQIFTWFEEDAMYFVSVVDPLWQTWLSWPLVTRARQRFFEVTP